MKSENEPAISLPEYFKFVKNENMFYEKKKTNKQKEENFARARVELRTTDV